jgi:hypothetical protein
MDHLDRDSIRRRALVVLCALSTFAVANAFTYWRHTPRCLDCQYTTGIPFAFLEEGGFAGIRRLLWRGVAGDIAAILAVGLLADRAAAQSRTRRLGVTVRRRLQGLVDEDSQFPLKPLAVGFLIMAAAYIIALFTKR